MNCLDLTVRQNDSMYKRWLVIPWSVYLLSFLVPVANLDGLGWQLFCLGIESMLMLCPAWLANPLFWLASYYFWKGEIRKAAKLGAVSVGLGVSFWAWVWLAMPEPDWFKLIVYLIPYWVWLASLSSFSLMAWLIAPRSSASNAM